MTEQNVYERNLENVNSGLWLQMEGAFGRYINNTFLESGIFKPTKETTSYIDGYNRQRVMPVFEIDQDRIDELWEDNPEFMHSIEGDCDDNN